MSKVLPNSCPDKCGNMTIPYPFGIGQDCYHDVTFGVECYKSTSLFSPLLAKEFKEISLSGYATVIGNDLSTCFNDAYNGLTYPFSVSLLRNKFVAIGCNIYAYIQGEDGMPSTTGCASFCNNRENYPTFYGGGYCETSLPRSINSFSVGLYTANTLTNAGSEIPCNFAFIVDKNFSKFDGINYSDWENIVYDFPLVLDWVIGNISCGEASRSTDYLCNQNAECRDGNSTGMGYNCYCQQGYQGNPYLSNGCQDIDECKDPKNNNCIGNSTCINTPGSYVCFCPTGYSSYSAEDGWRCTPGQEHQFSTRNLLLGRTNGSRIYPWNTLLVYVLRHIWNNHSNKLVCDSVASCDVPPSLGKFTGQDFERMEIESDSENAVNFVKEGPRPNSPMKALVKECKIMTTTKSSVAHTLRERNRVTDALARDRSEQDEKFITL
ncbi:hypothetical protein Vadar_026250 [Vaccinium darrowii]|uniref:Uncharacterized protein n=1 Tax=Vaccinium darrowii TaxID=229202 RepID=A0ACB7XCF0_9ERIC|nr:hypothetical protein Vadar_026250 [Vaccinium darrowii]